MEANEIRKQSLVAYNQWGAQWRDHCKIHSKYKMKHLADFHNHGIGKACLLIANGASFERNLDTILKYQDNVDIMVCDKTLGSALEHGIKPTFCIVCDANVSYEKYMEKYKDQLQDITLFMNACGNPEWSENGNWKDRYFFVNKDILKSEKEFGGISGCQNFIPAGTNVSNAMLVFLTQSDERGAQNFFGYSKYLLIGYDYSWQQNGNYYAFNKDGGGKTNYMRHKYLKDFSGHLSFTSNNLEFSARWLHKYVTTYNLPVVQCSRDTIFIPRHLGRLEEQMQFKGPTEDRESVSGLMLQRNALMQNLSLVDKQLRNFGKKHELCFLQSV